MISELEVDHNESSVEIKSAMHTWRYRHHFTYKADQGKNIIVQCNLCLPRVNLLSTSKTSTSNLKKHLDVSYTESDDFPFPFMLMFESVNECRATLVINNVTL